MEVCGDVSDADVIASNKALAELPDILGRRSLEDHKKVVVSRRQEINKRLAEIPVRIDETNNGKPDTSDIKMTRDGIEAEIKKLKDRKASKEKERSQVKDGGPSTDLYTKHTRAERELTRAKAEFSSDQDRRSRDQEKQLYDIDTRVKELTAEQDRLAKSMRDNMAAASEFQDRLECLRKEWHQVNGTAMESPDVSDTCPTCGQGLPQDQVEAAKQKALEAFNFEKAAKLKQITAAGKRTSEKLKETEKLIEATDTRSKEINAEIDSLADERTKVQAKIDEIAAEKFEDTEKAKKLQAEVARLQAEIDKLDSGDNAEAIAKIDEEIRAIEEQLNTNQVALATLDHVDKADARIKELEAEQKKLSDEFEQMEKELYLTEQFTAAKANMLEEKINSHFNRARFRLFEQQINEGIKDTCATLCDGVPYPSANNAAQIQVGLDIINTLADFYQFRAPIWIDNAEAITRLPDIDSQLIELVVDERYPELTVFKAERPKQKKAS
jgi:chromosome segregation ATPase